MTPFARLCFRGLLTPCPPALRVCASVCADELLTSALPITLLADDNPHALGCLLFRLCSHSPAPELVPLLRLLEAAPTLAAEMPRYTGTMGRKGVVGE